MTNIREFHKLFEQNFETRRDQLNAEIVLFLYPHAGGDLELGHLAIIPEYNQYGLIEKSKLIPEIAAQLEIMGVQADTTNNMIFSGKDIISMALGNEPKLEAALSRVVISGLLSQKTSIINLEELA